MAVHFVTFTMNVACVITAISLAAVAVETSRCSAFIVTSTAATVVPSKLPILFHIVASTTVNPCAASVGSKNVRLGMNAENASPWPLTTFCPRFLSSSQ